MPKTLTPAIEAVWKYVALDRRIKELEAARTALKEPALAALDAIGGSTTDALFTVTRVEPNETKIDLVVLKEATSARLFNKLTARVPDLEVIRNYVGAEKLNEQALTAIAIRKGTPRIFITVR